MEAEGSAPLLSRQNTLGSGVASRTIRKLDSIFLTLCSGVIFLSYVNRTNIGYAAKDLCHKLNLTHKEYGLGVSVFYTGYLSSQVIGNAILRRVGAHVWLAIIVFAWGCVATVFGLIQTVGHFYALRVLLGVAEGGTFPGIWYAISLFYPEEYLAGAYSAVAAAICFSMPISSPIAAGLLALGPIVNVEGWRLLFVVEGLIPIVYSLVLYTFLPASPESASFLAPEEKEWIAVKQQRHLRASEISFFEEVKIVLSSVNWWIAASAYLLVDGVKHVLIYWSTLIIHDTLNGGEDDDKDSKTCGGSKHGNAAVAILLTAIPFLISGSVCLFLKKAIVLNRPRFCTLNLAVSGVSLVLWTFTREASFAVGFILLCSSVSCAYAISGPLHSLTLGSFDSSTRCTATSLYHVTIGVGPLVLPPIMGILVDDFGYNSAVLMCGCMLLVSAVLILFMKDPLSKKEERADNYPTASAAF